MSEDNVDQLLDEFTDPIDDPEPEPELDDDGQDSDGAPVDSEGEVLTEDLTVSTGHRAQDVQHLTANDIAYAKALGLSE